MDLSAHFWNSFVNEGTAFGDTGVTVGVHPTTRRWLKISHTIVALNHIAIATVQQPLFYGSVSILSISGSPLRLGLIEVKNRHPPKDPKSEYPTGGNLTASDFPASGTITSTEDPSVTIDYNFHGRKINSKDMFLSVMDLLATMAVKQFPDTCEYITAVGPYSATGQAVIHMNDFGAATGTLLCDVYAQVIDEIFTQLNLGQNQWMEITFDIHRTGKKIGQGHVDKFEAVSSNRSIA